MTIHGGKLLTRIGILLFVGALIGVVCSTTIGITRDLIPQYFMLSTIFMLFAAIGLLFTIVGLALSWIERRDSRKATLAVPANSSDAEEKSPIHKPRAAKTAKVLVVTIGLVAVLAALFGLYYNSMSLSSALGGAFADMAAEKGLIFMMPAFYIMSSICIVCYLILLACGLDMIRARVRCFWLMTSVLLFEIAYFFLVSVLWMVPDIGMSVGAATGIANGGLMIQYAILFPLWAPIVLSWARTRMKSDISPA